MDGVGGWEERKKKKDEVMKKQKGRKAKETHGEVRKEKRGRPAVCAPVISRLLQTELTCLWEFLYNYEVKRDFLGWLTESEEPAMAMCSPRAGGAVGLLQSHWPNCHKAKGLHCWTPEGTVGQGSNAMSKTGVLMKKVERISSFCPFHPGYKPTAWSHSHVRSIFFSQFAVYKPAIPRHILSFRVLLSGSFSSQSEVSQLTITSCTAKVRKTLTTTLNICSTLHHGKNQGNENKNKPQLTVFILHLAWSYFSFLVYLVDQNQLCACFSRHTMILITPLKTVQQTFHGWINSFKMHYLQF